MEWTKIIISTTSGNAEIITAVLYDLGIYSVELIDPNEIRSILSDPQTHWDYVDDSLAPTPGDDDDVSIIFYLGTDTESRTLIEQLKAELANQSFAAESLKLHTETVTDQAWLHEWKKYFHPIRVGRIIIVPAWEKPHLENTSDIACIIDPGSAFGTGQHITTSLCIEALQDRLSHDNIVLDIGSGSGILSIASLLLDAKKVVSVDIDPSAVEATRKNAEINAIDLNLFQVLSGNILSSSALLKTVTEQGPYTVVVANIVADVLIDLAPIITNLLQSNGLFIASGIITERLDDVLYSFTDAGLSLLETKTVDGWCCVVASNG